jgi:hypothetical protein
MAMGLMEQEAGEEKRTIGIRIGGGGINQGG